ncbi:phosphorylase [Nostoc sp. HG1]|nr:phosphorylase [Nostoc sp. HG1]
MESSVGTFHILQIIKIEFYSTLSSYFLLTLLVPQGAEYQAVCRGLKSRKNPPQVVALPIGVEPVTQFLTQWQQSSKDLESGVLVMGLCGSLTAKLRVGDRVLYQSCQNASGKILECDPTLTAQIQQHLTETTLVRAFTSDRVISSAHEKQQLGQIHQADVVDMEGSAIMTILAQAGVAVAMARVVSDDIDHDLPDLSAAISPDGKLRSLPLALGMIRQPIAALRLIRGSLKGLQALEAISARLP